MSKSQEFFNIYRPHVVIKFRFFF